MPLLLLLSLVALGCDDGPRREAAPSADVATDAPDPEPPPPPPTAGQRRMHDRYEQVIDLREALVRGDLDRARAIAATIRPVALGQLPEAAHSMRDMVPTEARAIADAPDLSRASQAFSRLLSRCGKCHETADASWRWSDPAVPEGEDLSEHMRRHQYAVERMWEALITNDLERFDAAADVLSEAPLTGDSPPAREEPPGLSDLASRVHTLAAGARRAPDMQARAALFADLLGTCADCHARIP